MVFTYRVPEAFPLAAGCRVMVPFRRKRLVGIVTELHDRAPKVEAKDVFTALDEADAPALSDELLRLGKWISEYYLAPLGEVFRTMLPLNAEFRRDVVYMITDEGRLALHLAGEAGSSRRSTSPLVTRSFRARFPGFAPSPGEGWRATATSSPRAIRSRTVTPI